MSEATHDALRILHGNSGEPTARQIERAQVLATIAAADALESIAETLRNILDRGGLH